MAKFKSNSLDVDVTQNTTTNINQKKNALLATLQKKYGNDSVKLLSTSKVDIDYISTGSMSLNMAIGIGGVPLGRIVEIYGPESTGKTTICMEIIREAQLKFPDRICLFVDMENAFSTELARNMNIDLDNVVLITPHNGEEAFDTIEEFIKEGIVSVAVIDSVSAMVPKAETEGEMGDNMMGVQARMMGKGLRKLTPVAAKNNTTVIFINQLREKIGVMFGNPETTSGGNALKFHSSVRLEIRKDGQPVKNKEGVPISTGVKVKVIKNKVAPPHKTCEFEIIYGHGIDKVGDLLNSAINLEVLKKGGAWIEYPKEPTKFKFQGVEKAKEALTINKSFYETIKNEVLTKYNEKIKSVDSSYTPEEEVEDPFDE